MTDAACRNCGAPLVGDGAGRLCPACLLQMGLTPGSDGARWTASPAAAADRLEQIGPYRILERLGEGGMGIVYLAEQKDPIRRRVALKVIKLGMDTQRVVARFEAERQALALMDHPNIATVLDAGSTDEGRPFFVMEHVGGLPITEYCDRHRLSTSARLELFLELCAAVQHAHQKGIVHRDIKPSNILVTDVDGRPVPKVIDFGVAKATNQHLVEHTLFTEHGLLVGTPEYMSPEQVGLTGQAVDTRTDIYALGVVLYELLVGALPFDFDRLRESGYEEVQRTIRDMEPPRLTTRLASLGAATSDLAARRRTVPAALRRLVSGDLDWITQKALAKEPDRRYQSASELGMDVQRHLDQVPVVASPPSAAYRIGKFVRRHRAPVAAIATVLLAVVTLGTTALVLGIRAQRRGEAVWVNSVVTAAESAADPVVGALLLLETADRPRADRRLSVARALADEPLPQAVLEVPDWLDAAIAPDGSMLAVASLDGRAVLMRTDGQGAPVVLDTGRPVPVTAVAFSPDGRQVVTGSDDGTARLWSSDGAGESLALVGHAETVWQARFSPNGDYIATGGGNVLRPTIRESVDPALRVWRADGSGGPRVLGEHDAAISAIDISRDGRRIVTGSYDGTVRVWDPSGSTAPVVLRGHSDVVNDVAFSPDGALVASASDDRGVRIWRADGRGQPRELLGHHGAVGDVGFSPDGRVVFSAAGNYFGPGPRRNNAVILWSLTDGWPPVVISDAEGPVDAVEITADGSTLVTSARDGAVRLYGMAGMSRNGAPSPVVLRGVVGFSYALVSADSRTLVHLRNDNTAPVFDLAALTETREVLAESGEFFTAHDVSPDGRLVALAGYRAGADRPGYVSIRAADTWEEIERLDAHAGRLMTVRFSHDGTRLVTASTDSTAMVFTLGSGEAPIVLGGHPPNSLRAAFSPDGSRVVTASADGRLRLFELANPDRPVVGPLSDERYVLSAEFTPDGAEVLAVVDNTRVVLWPAAGGEPRTLASGFVKGAAISPDGTLIAVTTGQGRVRVLRRADGSEVSEFAAHGGMLFQSAFSPDGTRLVTGFGEDIRVWRLDGTEEMSTRGSGESVIDVGFTADGRSIVGVTGAAVRRWRATWPELRDYFRGRLRACLNVEQRVRSLGESRGQADAAVATCRSALRRSAEGEPLSPASMK